MDITFITPAGVEVASWDEETFINYFVRPDEKLWSTGSFDAGFRKPGQAVSLVVHRSEDGRFLLTSDANGRRYFLKGRGAAEPKVRIINPNDDLLSAECVLHTVEVVAPVVECYWKTGELVGGDDASWVDDEEESLPIEIPGMFSS